ncbi:MAG: peptidyl-prolyl cis-trans isomerase [Alphaproteobacteria bacterium]
MSYRVRLARCLAGAAACAAIALCATVVAAQPAPKGEKDSKDVVVAIVDGSKIMLSELEAEYNALPERLRQTPFDQVYRPLLERVIQIKLVANEARKQKLQDDPEVKRRLAQVEDRLIQEVFMEKIVAGKISDDAVKAKYDVLIKEFKGEEEVRASHIVVKTKAEADALIGQLQRGADFAKLVKDKSISPSKATAGDLGYFVPSQAIKPFADATAALKVGEVAKSPVQTDQGWHVIKVTERRKPTTPTFNDVKERLKQEMQVELIAVEVDKLRAKSKVERFDAKGVALPEPPPAKKPDPTAPADKK